MNLATLLALLSLTLADPTGDAIGDGTLDPPTSPVYANVAMFDLQGVELDVAEDGSAVLRVSLGALGAAVTGGGDGSLGADGSAVEPQEEAFESESLRLEEAGQFDISGMLAVVDVYLDTGEGGAEQTLNGPNMLLPAGSGWHYAVRVSAEGAWGVTYVGGSVSPPSTLPEPEETRPDGEEGGPPEPEPQTLSYVPLPTERSGNELALSLPWTLDPTATVDVFAMTGVHDPFSPSGWRQISPTPSPWAFSGGEQIVPVIDLLARDPAAQSAALRSGVLPRPDRGGGLALPRSPWLWLMVAGVAVALVGLVLRGRVARPAAASPEAPGAGSDEGDSDAVEVVPESDDDVDVLATLIPFDDDEDDDELGEQLDAVVEADGAGEPAAVTQLEASPEDEEGAQLLTTEEEPEPEPVAEAGGEALLDRGTPVPDQTPPAERRSDATFSTAVDESYLQVGSEADDQLYVEELPEDLESFWHPASRARKTLVELVPDLGTEAPEEAEGEAEDEAGTA